MDFNLFKILKNKEKLLGKITKLDDLKVVKDFNILMFGDDEKLITQEYYEKN